jgi:tRNA dimethylallyltransferase
MITILGPTATGKTALAARLAYETGGEVISADSRQVYRRMDLGTGKDYQDFIVGGTKVPFHLIDIAEPGEEYNIFEYQKDFSTAYHDITSRGNYPILCGGSGMYIEAVLKGYRLPVAATDENFVKELDQKSDNELIGILKTLKPLHNKTDIEDRSRMLKAILIIAGQTKIAVSNENGQDFPSISPNIFGISFPRELVMSRIVERLKTRLDQGMITEVENLIAEGISPERLMKYGLEYKFITLYITGKISYPELFENLNIAIRQFAKRQMTWFRRMERQGFDIKWIDGRLPLEQKIDIILKHTVSAR